MRLDDDPPIYFMSNEEVAREGLSLTKSYRNKDRGIEYLILSVGIGRSASSITEAFRVISNWPGGYIVIEVSDKELIRLDKMKGKKGYSHPRRMGRTDLD